LSAGVVIAVCRSPIHDFSKPVEEAIELVEGLGVKDDSHFGATVQHLVRVREDPTKPNLRQVHLLHSELFEELRAAGFSVAPGEIGENITTRGIDLLGLPDGTLLRIGKDAIVRVTGLRNPCKQIDKFQTGLMSAMLGRDAEGNITRKSGIMSVVLKSGQIRAGDTIRVELPAEPHRPLGRL
jgi:MOSC domain-containing protein YiiM